MYAQKCTTSMVSASKFSVNRMLNSDNWYTNSNDDAAV